MSKFTALQREAILRRISDVPLQSVFKFIDNSELKSAKKRCLKYWYNYFIQKGLTKEEQIQLTKFWE